MKNSAINVKKDFIVRCVHEEIYLPGNDDFIYRKAYKGDWGDWDEQPNSEASNEEYFGLKENETSSNEETPSSYENSYL